ncbi:hypothetical protein CPB84DRAFT_1743643 [Gymnopilus junonius]|uniref:Uncharacterized protein n=1 Tax=Gymnopilus junonius TaxID=109634 RepID=A0A9P5TTU2_GYMJU|nr:hypothetical protein CPB84DRAFT_1743643 [Gymnopilus junonius]
MLSLPWLWTLLLLLSGPVLGNTEIVNFSASKNPLLKLAFTEKWPILRPSSSSTQINVTSAPLGSVLPRTTQMNGQASEVYSPVVLAAFNPTISSWNFDPQSLQVFADQNIAIEATETRRKYARIQFVHTGVLTPWASNKLDDTSRYTVPIHIIVEPLHFGVLPSSVIPVVCSIIAVIVVGLPIAARINRYLYGIVQHVRVQKRNLKVS